MKHHLVLASLFVTALGTTAQTYIGDGHADLGIAYEAGVLEPHVHDETHDIEYAPGDAVLFLGATTLTTAPGTASFSFLGPAGAPVWILPATQSPDRLFLGIGAEEIESGIFQNDTISLKFVGLEGPGHFAAYTVNGFGSPSVVWNSADGINASDVATVLAGGHSHYNYAFTAPGQYTVSLQASGILANGSTLVESGVAQYRFAVVPEPGTVALGALGALALVAILAKSRR